MNSLSLIDLPVDQEALESFSDGISVCLEDLNKVFQNDRIRGLQTTGHVECH